MMRNHGLNPTLMNREESPRPYVAQDTLTPDQIRLIRVYMFFYRISMPECKWSDTHPDLPHESGDRHITSDICDLLPCFLELGNKKKCIRLRSADRKHIIIHDENPLWITHFFEKKLEIFSPFRK